MNMALLGFQILLAATMLYCALYLLSRDICAAIRSLKQDRPRSDHALDEPIIGKLTGRTIDDEGPKFGWVEMEWSGQHQGLVEKPGGRTGWARSTCGQDPGNPGDIFFLFQRGGEYHFDGAFFRGGL